MNVLDRLRASITAFRDTSRPVGRSLSQERARDRIGRSYLGRIGNRVGNDDPLLASRGGGDIALWRDILDDERCYSCFQQRRLAVISRPWEVEPGADDPASLRAAEFIRDVLGRIGWDRVCDKMLHGIWYGYAAGEAVYRVEPEGEWAGLIGLDRIDVPDRAWFGFDAEGGLRIIDTLGLRDEPVPEHKFWHFSAGADHDFAHYGVGLAHWLFWPVYFKRQGLPFWLRFLERFGSPTVKGSVSAGKLDDQQERVKVLDILRSVAADGAVAVPDWMEIDLLDAARSGAAGYEQLLDRMDAAIARVILSQTMTSDDGSSYSQAMVHKDVRDEIVRADSDLLHESFNNSIVRWLTEFNFPGAIPPRVYRIVEDQDDLNALATRDEALKRLGWERGDDNFLEVYGAGYVRTGPAALAPVAGTAFTAADIDAVDRIVSDMAGAGSDAVAEFVAPLGSTLAGVENPEALRVALLEHLETADPAALQDALAKAMIAVRGASETGIDPDRLSDPA